MTHFGNGAKRNIFYRAGKPSIASKFKSLQIANGHGHKIKDIRIIGLILCSYSKTKETTGVLNIQDKDDSVNGLKIML